MMAIFDWQAKPKKGKVVAPIAHGKSTRAKILSLGFTPDSQGIVATCVKEVAFISFTKGIKSQKGTGWGNKGAESVLTQAFVGNTLYTGAYSGDIIVWNGRNLKQRIKAHTGRINAMYSLNGVLVTGGHDGKVNVWQGGNASSLQKGKTYDLTQANYHSTNPKATSVCIDQSGNCLIGTRGGEIITVSQNGQSAVHMRAHYDGELWGLAAHPTKSEMVTYGRDSMLAVWDMPTRRQKKYVKLDGPGDGLAISNNAQFLAVGMSNGTFEAFQYETLTKIQSLRNRKGKAISVIKFSPNDEICAVGAHD